MIGSLSCSQKQHQEGLVARWAVKKKTTKKKTGGGFGGAKGKKKGGVSKEASALKLATAQAAEEVRSTGDAEAWLRLGAVLTRSGEYAEAERIFELAQKEHPSDEMINAGLLTLRGHSASYHRGPCGRIDEERFDSVLVSVEEPHRTVTFKDDALATVSKTSLIPPHECAEAIKMAERYAAKHGGWTTSRHVQAATTDIPVKDVPELLEWFNAKLRDQLFPVLAARFPSHIPSPDIVRAHDAFIVKYDANSQRSLPAHIDESSFSFTIALNDDYEGGGTLFQKARLSPTDPWGGPTLMNAPAGGVVAFPGKARHSGAPTTSGLRYIIPLFCYLDQNLSAKRPGYFASTLPGGSSLLF